MCITDGKLFESSLWCDLQLNKQEEMFCQVTVHVDISVGVHLDDLVIWHCLTKHQPYHSDISSLKLSPVV